MVTVHHPLPPVSFLSPSVAPVTLSPLSPLPSATFATSASLLGVSCHSLTRLVPVTAGPSLSSFRTSSAVVVEVAISPGVTVVEFRHRIRHQSVTMSAHCLGLHNPALCFVTLCREISRVTSCITAVDRATQKVRFFVIDPNNSATGRTCRERGFARCLVLVFSKVHHSFAVSGALAAQQALL